MEEKKRIVPKLHWILFFIEFVSSIFVRIFESLQWQYAIYVTILIGSISFAIFLISYILRIRQRKLSFHVYHGLIIILMVLYMLISLAAGNLFGIIPIDKLLWMSVLVTALFSIFTYVHLKKNGYQTKEQNRALLLFVQNEEEDILWWSSAFTILYTFL